MISKSLISRRAFRGKLKATVEDGDGPVPDEIVRVGRLDAGEVVLEVGRPGTVGNLAITFRLEALEELAR